MCSPSLHLVKIAQEVVLENITRCFTTSLEMCDCQCTTIIAIETSLVFILKDTITVELCLVSNELISINILLNGLLSSPPIIP